MIRAVSLAVAIVIGLSGFPGVAVAGERGEGGPPATASGGSFATPGFALPAWSDPIAGGRAYFTTLRTGNVDGQGGDEVIIRLSDGIHVYGWDPELGKWARPLSEGRPAFTDASGFNLASYRQTLRVGDLDGDGAAEILIRDGLGIQAWTFHDGAFQELPRGPGWSDAGGWSRPEYYKTIRVANIDGLPGEELVIRDGLGIEAFTFKGGVWSELPRGPGWSDDGGWNQPKYYKTLRTGDLDGDGADELIIRDTNGIEAFTFKVGAWVELPRGPAWSDSSGFNQPPYYNSIRVGDVDGDGADELLVRDALGIEAFTFKGGDWSELPRGPDWSDEDSYGERLYRHTITLGDIDGDADEDLLVRNSRGMEAWTFESGSWKPLVLTGPFTDADGWGHKRYYETILLADVDGLFSLKPGARSEPKVEVIGRGPTGIQTYRFVRDTRTWRSPSIPFPDMTQGEYALAYQAINRRLAAGNPEFDLRTAYLTADNTELSFNYPTGINDMETPSGVQQEVWDDVKRQFVEVELPAVAEVQRWFELDLANDLLRNTFVQNLELDDVAALFEIDEQSDEEIQQAFFEVLGGAIEVGGEVLGGEESTAPFVVATILATALTTAALTAEGGSIQGSYRIFKQQLLDRFEDVASGLGVAKETVVSDYGLLIAVSRLRTSGTWRDMTAAEEQAFLAAMLGEYTLSLWQSLSAATWKIDEIHPDEFNEPCTGRSFCYQQVFFLRWSGGVSIPDERADQLFSPPTSNANGHPCSEQWDSSCALGQSRDDVFCGRGGWSIPYASGTNRPRC